MPDRHKPNSWDVVSTVSSAVAALGGEVHCKKVQGFSLPQLFPARESLVSDIPRLGTGKSLTFFYSVQLDLQHFGTTFFIFIFNILGHFYFISNI